MISAAEGISGVIVTRGERLHLTLPLIRKMKSITDEMVILLDNPDIDIARELKKYADKVYTIASSKGCQEAYTEIVLLNCSYPWILKMDDDEALDIAWTYEILHQMANDKNATNYWFPRKWMINEDEFIVSKPWFPDYQLRLFRNLPSIIKLPEKLHEIPIVPGEIRYRNDLFITHWDLSINNRSVREAKTEYYIDINPEVDCTKYYLYEDYEIETLTDSFFDSDTKHAFSPLENNCEIQISNIKPINNTIANSRSLFYFTISNYTALTLRPNNPTKPYSDNIFLSYHIFNADGSIYQWDHHRVPFPTQINYGESASLLMDIEMPSRPGKYLLQIDIIEEDVRWFSSDADDKYFPMFELIVQSMPDLDNLDAITNK